MPEPERRITQSAPWPDELEDLVAHFWYRPGWTFHLLENLVRDHEDPNNDSSPPLCQGTTLDIITWGYNSYHAPTRGEWATLPAPELCGCGQPWPCPSYEENGRRGPYRVHHYKIVPAAVFNRVSWQWWLLQMCKEVEDHETAEFFRLVYDDTTRIGTETFGETRREERPFRPVHAPGWNPYMLTAAAPESARRTSFRGVEKVPAPDASGG